jgi:hypothetical protein
MLSLSFSGHAACVLLFDISFKLWGRILCTKGQGLAGAMKTDRRKRRRPGTGKGQAGGLLLTFKDTRRFLATVGGRLCPKASSTVWANKPKSVMPLEALGTCLYGWGYCC